MNDAAPPVSLTAARASVALFLGAPLLLLALVVALRVGEVHEGVHRVQRRILLHERLAAPIARQEGVELSLILAVAACESGGRADAVSPAGAVGLMQLMEGTAVELAGGGRPDRLDPETSLRLGARYLREQLDRFAAYPCGEELALAAYNAGPGRVKKWLAERPLQADRERLGAWIPFRETRNYVRRVAAWRERWELELESSR